MAGGLGCTGSIRFIGSIVGLGTHSMIVIV